MEGSRYLDNFFRKCVFFFTILFVVGLFFPVVNAFAESTGVSTAEELQSYFETGGDVKLLNDITMSSTAYVQSNTILDLNGHTLNLDSNTLIPYGATLTVRDTTEAQSGSITSTSMFTIQIGSNTIGGGLVLESGNIDCQGSYGVRNYGDFTINGGTISASDFTIYNQSDSLVMNGGTIVSSNGTAIANYEEGASFVMNGGLVKTLADDVAVRLSRPNTSFVMNDGTIEAMYGNYETNSGGDAVVGYKYTEVTINGGSLTSFGNTVAGNGSKSGNSEGTGAKININGGTLTSIAGAGVYAPQIAGVTTITGGTITGLTGIEIRAGTLNVSGGTIIGVGEYSVAPVTSGLTTHGAAISVSQHTTAQPITVNITGGTYEAEVPLSNTNPLEHDEIITNQVVVNVMGGKYIGDEFQDVSDHVSEGYVEVEEETEETKIVEVTQTNPAGYYLSANTSGSVDISTLSGNIATDYSEIQVISNCQAGYNVTMSTTGNDNSLYYNSDDTSPYSFSPITNDAPLNAISDVWGYRMSDDVSYVPSESDTFRPVPILSNPVTLKTISDTASDSDIDDKFRLHFGANAGFGLRAGEYKLPRDSSTNPGGIVYQITTSPVCTDLPIQINFNQNIDGEGGDETDSSVADFPTYMNNRLHTVAGSPTTMTLSGMVPTRDDYTFVEWNLLPDGSGTSYQPGDVIVVGDDVSEGELIGNITLYAIWVDGCPGGAICYDGNGADAGSMDNQTGTRGATVTLIASNFSRDGYGFAGWNTKPDGTGDNYGPNQSIGIPMSGGKTLYANWIMSSGSMQTWNGANSMSVGDIVALTDRRDGETYAVAKLADGNVWMIENFRLVPSVTSFDALDTNNPNGDFIAMAKRSASTNDFCNQNNTSCVDTVTFNANNLDRELVQSPTNNDTESAWYSYGVLYNWYTATAGNGTFDFTNTSGTNQDGTVAGDICPAGWHLPTGNNGEFVALDAAVNGVTNNDGKLLYSPVNFVHSGDFTYAGASERGGYGRLWSSTASEKNRAYRFGYVDYSVTPNNTWNKWAGFSVRCIYDGNRIPSSEVTVNLGEHVTSVRISNNTYGSHVITTSGTSLLVADNIPYNVSAEFEDGYTIDTWTTTTDGQLDNPGAVSTGYTIIGDTTLSVAAKVATATTYTLNYDTSPSTETVASDTAVSYNVSYDFSVTNVNPVVFGSSLIGWSETEGATTADYVGGDTITLVNVDPDNISSVTKTLYAVYQEDTCPAGNICYFGNGADAGALVQQTVSSNANVKLLPSNFSKSGYGFAGWITDENATPFGPNANYTVPDVDTAGLKLYAKWIESEGDLQTWNSCSTLQLGKITALTDIRDNNTYAVAKLGDGKCWMVENMRLDVGEAEITATNTNIPTSSFVTEAGASTTASSKALCNSNNATCFNKIQYNANNIDRSMNQDYDDNNNASAWYSYGVYYNWYTATAGNGTYDFTGASGSQGDGNVSGDICPAGWHLPTGNTTGEYNNLNATINGGATNSDANWRNYPNNFVWSGDYNNNKRTGSYSSTRLWTSTAKDNNSAYRLGLESAKNPYVTASSNVYNKWDAFAIRCVSDN